MKILGTLIFFLVTVSVVGSAVLSSELLLSADNFDARECPDSQESEESLEKSEVEKWAPQAHENLFAASLYTYIDFDFLVLVFKDIHIEIIIPPPELA